MDYYICVLRNIYTKYEVVIAFKNKEGTLAYLDQLNKNTLKPLGERTFPYSLVKVLKADTEIKDLNSLDS